MEENFNTGGQRIEDDFDCLVRVNTDYSNLTFLSMLKSSRRCSFAGSDYLYEEPNHTKHLLKGDEYFWSQNSDCKILFSLHFFYTKSHFL